MSPAFRRPMPHIHKALNDDEKPHSAASAVEIGSPARSAARTDSLRALQHTNRADLCPLGEGFHPVSRAAPSGRNGAGGDRGVSVVAGERAQRGGIDAQAGAVGAALHVLAGARHRPAVDERHRSAARDATAAGGAVAGRGAARVHLDGRRAPALRAAAVRHRHAVDRGSAPAGQGSGFRAAHRHRARGQGAKGPRPDAAAGAGHSAARAAGTRPCAVGRRPSMRARGGRDARCACPQVPACRSVMGLVLGVSAGRACGRSAQRRGAPPPYV